MIVGICGYGYTGSGAVIDLLKEYDECSIIDDFEFCFTYIPYGLEDLRYHLVDHPQRYNSSEAAIKDFERWVNAQNTVHNAINVGTQYQFVQLSENFITALNPVEWRGYSSFDYVHYGWIKKKILFRIMNRLNKTINKFFHCDVIWFPNDRMRIAYLDKDAYMKEARKYISNLILSTGVENKPIIVLNQPFEANTPEQSFEYYDNPKAIVVDKDPRDLYLLIKKTIMTEGKFIPCNSVNTFIEYYKTLRRMIGSDKEKDVLRIRFEDLIYEYESSIEYIEKFVGLKSHITPRKFFDPNRSINNTQLFKRYPEYANDIKTIERELPEFLYPFDKYKEVEFNGESF